MVTEHLNGFDRIAGVYDRLARLVFGRSIVKAQLYFLDEIPARGNVLVLGGGTGWLLAELLQRKPACSVWYVEASQKMIALTQKRIPVSRDVHYIHGTERSLPAGIVFDAVITNFYLDLFQEGPLREVVKSIKAGMSQQGLWLATDFTDEGKWWQRVLLGIMYRFFKTATGIEAGKMPAWDKMLPGAGLVPFRSAAFYGGFIKSVLYTVTGVDR